ncbi:hypothetical protein [uncultured Bacteroides sp.]|uniref:hypothetical protein n=1 Tax=uncultured Bacteroides sp. TaxID=162156 RepID=UPI002AA6B872|nr:hypothetical protein [uncultured Bacteroides sp.]
MTKHSENSLVYAYQESKLTFVDNVPNGKKCNCKCPFCEEEVIAYNGGKIQAHHFTHSKSSDCGESSHESIIHLLAKEILEETKKIKLPKYPGLINNINKEVVCIFDKTILEQYIKNIDKKIKPDVIGKRINKEDIFIEIFYKHQCDHIKIQKLKEGAYYCLEVCLGDIPWNIYDDLGNREKLKQIFETGKLNSCSNIIRWITNPYYEKLLVKQNKKQDKEECEFTDNSSYEFPLYEVSQYSNSFSCIERDQFKERMKDISYEFPVEYVSYICDLLDKKSSVIDLYVEVLTDNPFYHDGDYIDLITLFIWTGNEDLVDRIKKCLLKIDINSRSISIIYAFQSRGLCFYDDDHPYEFNAYKQGSSNLEHISYYFDIINGSSFEKYKLLCDHTINVVMNLVLSIKYKKILFGEILQWNSLINQNKNFRKDYWQYIDVALDNCFDDEDFTRREHFQKMNNSKKFKKPINLERSTLQVDKSSDIYALLKIIFPDIYK